MSKEYRGLKYSLLCVEGIISGYIRNEHKIQIISRMCHCVSLYLSAFNLGLCTHYRLTVKYQKYKR